MAKPKQVTFSEAPKSNTTAKPDAGVLIIDTPGTRRMVDLLAQAKDMLELANNDITAVRADLDPYVTAERDKAEAAGTFTKHVQVKGPKCNARYTFKDAFAPMDVAVKDQLIDVLGPLFGQLFEAGKSITIKKGQHEDLVTFLQGLGVADRFLDVDHHIAPVEGFREKRAEVRGQLNDDANAVLDSVVQQVGQKPSLTFK